MTDTASKVSLFERFRWLPLAMVAITLVVFGAAIVSVTRQLRHQIRQQMIARDGEVFQAVLWLQYSNHLQSAPELQLDEPSVQFNLLLEISRMRGVLAARLFDARGSFVASVPPTVQPGALGRETMSVLTDLRCHSRFFEAANLAKLFLPGTALAAAVPLLEVNVPFYAPAQSQLLGSAQFYLDGQALATEFATLDQHLWQQGWLVFLVGGGLIVVGLSWTFRRLQQANMELRSRSESLARANQELILAAKTSATGAMSAHLIHGLKSPIIGLRNLFEGLASQPPGENQAGWQMAQKTIREMQQMINDFGKMLNNEPSLSQPFSPLADVLALAIRKNQPLAQQTGVRLLHSPPLDLLLENRAANLSLLILENLLRNALQATAHGGTVTLSTRMEAGQVVCQVQDEGTGFPDALRPHLFMPCQSTKPGGLGIGLAISKQLANHLGARLELAASSPRGCVFEFRLPMPPNDPVSSEKTVTNRLATTLILN
ncbi:MAG: HAMP domain-containing sensor histidine kinase [Verrucomicrobiota bacterium]